LESKEKKILVLSFLFGAILGRKESHQYSISSFILFHLSIISDI
jgi:hypothetical protein